MNLEPDQFRGVVERLVACPIMQSPSGRQNVVEQLPPPIRGALQLSPGAGAKQEVSTIVRGCLAYPSGMTDLLEVVRFFDAGTNAFEELARLLQSLTAPPPPPRPRRPRVFLSYKRNQQPDEGLALQLNTVLSQRYEVFLDQKMLVGTEWAAWIDGRLAEADFVLVLLSASSVGSEMVQAELARARELANSRGDGRPRVLPVRLAFQEPFSYPLSEYLNPLNWANWQEASDTPRLVEELSRAIEAGDALSQPPSIGLAATTTTATMAAPSLAPGAAVLIAPTPTAQPLELEKPEGTMRPGSAFYVVRAEDGKALSTIRGSGVTITIKGPRQMGKSSLLVRLIREARRLGKPVAFLDFQFFDKTALSDPALFYRQFCSWLSDKLDLEDRTDDPQLWRPKLGNSQRCTRYLERYILPQVGGKLVLTMDEVETMFDTSFRSDFFGMLRGWHNSRADEPLWENFDLVLVTSTEPYQLIDNLNQSPFNVGEVLELDNFGVEQVAELNRQHGTPLSPAQQTRLFELLAGHPFLTRRALFTVASGRAGATELFETATDDRGPFGDHLRNHLFRLHGHEELLHAVRGVLRKNPLDEQLFWRLRGAGLVRREGRTVLMRCWLYEQYFREHLL